MPTEFEQILDSKISGVYQTAGAEDTAVPGIKLGKHDTGMTADLAQYQSQVRAGNQTGGQALANALLQSAAEVSLGTLEGIGYLFDFPQLYNILNGTEQEFGNWFSDIMTKGKEAVAEAAPVHGGEGFQPGNWRWWYANMPSIVSTFSLMIPTFGATRLMGKVAGAAAKGLKTTKLAKAARGKKIFNLMKAEAATKEGLTKAGQGMYAALTSRYMENTMESTEVMQRVYDEEIAKGTPEEKAKEIASRAASNVWYGNLVNTIPDFFQHYMIFARAGKGLAAAAKSSSKLAKLAKSGVGQMVGQAISEGLEEGIQFGLGAEAAKSANVQETLLNVLSNFGDYFEDDDFKSSLLLGAFGGGMFGLTAPIIDRMSQKKADNAFNTVKAFAEKWTRGMASEDKNEQTRLTNEAFSDWTKTASPEDLLTKADEVEESDPDTAKLLRELSNIKNSQQVESQQKGESEEVANLKSNNTTTIKVNSLISNTIEANNKETLGKFNQHIADKGLETADGEQITGEDATAFLLVENIDDIASNPDVQEIFEGMNKKETAERKKQIKEQLTTRIGTKKKINKKLLKLNEFTDSTELKSYLQEKLINEYKTQNEFIIADELQNTEKAQELADKETQKRELADTIKETDPAKLVEIIDTTENKQTQKAAKAKLTQMYNQQMADMMVNLDYQNYMTEHGFVEAAYEKYPALKAVPSSRKAIAEYYNSKLDAVDAEVDEKIKTKESTSKEEARDLLEKEYERAIQDKGKSLALDSVLAEASALLELPIDQASTDQYYQAITLLANERAEAVGFKVQDLYTGEEATETVDDYENQAAPEDGPVTTDRKQEATKEFAPAVAPEVHITKSWNALFGETIDMWLDITEYEDDKAEPKKRAKPIAPHSERHWFYDVFGLTETDGVDVVRRLYDHVEGGKVFNARIKFAIPATTYSRKVTDIENLTIAFGIEENGVFKPLGRLRTMGNVMTANERLDSGVDLNDPSTIKAAWSRQAAQQLQEIRNEAWEMWKASDKQENVIFESSTLGIAKLNHIKHGRHWTVEGKESYTEVDALGEDTVIGTFDTDSNVGIKPINMDLLQKKFPDLNVNDIVEHGDPRDGRFYILVKDTSGKHRWVELRTKTVEEMPDKLAGLREVGDAAAAAEQALIDLGFPLAKIRNMRDDKGKNDFAGMAKAMRENPDGYPDKAAVEKFLYWVDNYQALLTRAQNIVSGKRPSGKKFPDFRMNIINMKAYWEENELGEMRFSTEAWLNAPIEFEDAAKVEAAREAGAFIKTLKNTNVQIAFKKFKTDPTYMEEAKSKLTTHLKDVNQPFVSPSFHIGFEKTPVIGAVPVQEQAKTVKLSAGRLKGEFRVYRDGSVWDSRGNRVRSERIIAAAKFTSGLFNPVVTRVTVYENQTVEVFSFPDKPQNIYRASGAKLGLEVPIQGSLYPEALAALRDAGAVSKVAEVHKKKSEVGTPKTPESVEGIVKVKIGRTEYDVNPSTEEVFDADGNLVTDDGKKYKALIKSDAVVYEAVVVTRGGKGSAVPQKTIYALFNNRTVVVREKTGNKITANKVIGEVRKQQKVEIVKRKGEKDYIEAPAEEKPPVTIPKKEELAEPMSTVGVTTITFKNKPYVIHEDNTVTTPDGKPVKQGMKNLILIQEGKLTVTEVTITRGGEKAAVPQKTIYGVLPDRQTVIRMKHGGPVTPNVAKEVIAKMLKEGKDFPQAAELKGKFTPPPPGARKIGQKPKQYGPASKKFKPGKPKVGWKEHKFDVEKAKRNIQKILKLSPKITKGLIEVGGVKAWGLTHDGMMVLSDAAKPGTEYHEAFHIVFNNILSKSERRKLLEHAKKVLPVDYEKTRAHYNLITEDYKPDNTTIEELAIEEALADAFMEYMLDRSAPTTMLSKLFRYLMDFIRDTLGLRTPIENMFRGIEKGKYRNTSLRSEPGIRLKVATDLNPREEIDFLNFAFKTLNEVAQYGDMSYEEVYRNALNTGVEENSILSSMGDSVYNILYSHFYYSGVLQSNPSAIRILRGLRPDIDYSFDNEGNPTQYIRDDVKEQEGDLYYLMVHHMSDKGVNIRFDPYEEFEYDESESGNFSEWVQFSDISVNLKKGLTANLKAKFSSYPSGKEDRLGLGMDLTYNGDEFYSVMISELGNSYSFEDMREKMKNSKSKMVQLVYEDAFNGENEEYQTQLWTHIAQKLKTSYKTILMGEYQGDTTMEILDSNRDTLYASIINNLFDKDLAQYEHQIRAIMDKARDGKNVKEDVNNILSEFLPSSVVDSLVANNKDYQAITDVYANLKKKGDFGSRFRDFALWLMDYYPQTFQDAHLSVAGKRIYEWKNNNFVGKFVSKLGSVTGFEKLQAFYDGDKMYTNLPLLANNPNAVLVETDGLKVKGRRKGKIYRKYSEKDTMTTMLGYYRGTGREGSSTRGIFMLPVLADAPVQMAFELNKYDKLTAIDMFVNVLRSEWLRVNEQTDLKAKNFDENKGKYQFVDLYNMKEFDPVAAKRIASDYVNKLTSDVMSKAVELGIYKDQKGEILYDKFPPSKKTPFEFTSEFVANHVLQHSQIMLLTTGDPAFYSSVEDFYKRAKELHSPVTYSRPGAKFGDVVVPDKIKANIVPSVKGKAPQFDDIMKVVPEREKEYSETDSTDGTTKVDLVTFRWQMISQERWDNVDQQMFDILMRGEIPTEFFGKWQTMKPFYYGLHKVEGKVVPIQKKDSELLIVPFYGREFINGVENNFYNEVYKSMLEDMGYTFTENEVTFDETHASRKYDMLTYDSTIKVGRIFNEDSNGLTTVDLAFENWGIQQETPQKFREKTGIFGTQLMKAIVADLDRTSSYTRNNYNGEASNEAPLTANEIIRRYSSLISEDIKRSYGGFKEDMADPKKLRALLIQQALNDGKGSDYVRYLSNPDFPLDHPAQYKVVAAMFYSIARKRITTRKFQSGFDLVLQTAHGFKRQPRIVWNKNTEGVEDPNEGIAYFEAYLPVYHNKLNAYMNDQGFIDEAGMKKLEEEHSDWLRAIGYRIPTEGKSSMFTIKAIGFLPFGVGNAVMPQECINIAGWDFDIDKLKGFLYSDPIDKDTFKYKDAMKTPEARKIKDKYSTQLVEIQSQIDESWSMMESEKAALEEQKVVDDTNISRWYAAEAAMRAKIYLEKGKLRRIDKKLAAIESVDAIDHDAITDKVNLMGSIAEAEKELQELINRRIELSKGKVRKSDMKSRVAEEIKWQQPLHNQVRELKEARNAEISALGSEERYQDYLNQIKSDNEKLDLMRTVLESKNTVKESLTPQGFGDIERVNKKIKELQGLERELDYLNPNTLVAVTKAMLDGKDILGIFASNLAIHNVLQTLDVKPLLEYSFLFNGKTYNTMGLTKAKEDNSHTTAGMLGMGVGMAADNGKNPQAEWYNSNEYTAGMESTMKAAGMDIKTVHTFMTQSVIRNFVKDYYNKGGTVQAEGDTRRDYGVKNARLHNVELENFETEELEDNLKHEIRPGVVVPKDVREYNRKILEHFLAYKELATLYGMFTKSIKQADKGLGPTVGDSFMRVRNYQQEHDIVSNYEEVKKQNSFMFDFMEYGVIKANEDIQDVEGGFMRIKEGLSYILDQFENWKSYPLTAEEVNSIIDEYMTFAAQTTNPYSGERVLQIVNNLQKYKQDMPEHPLLSRIKVVYVQNPVDKITRPYLEFNGVTGTDPSEQDHIKKEWYALPDDIKYDLIDYSTWQSGMGSYTFRGFGHMQPAQIHEENYAQHKDTLTNIKNALYFQDVSMLNTFMDQYIRNNYKNLLYVPSVTKEDVTFMKDGSIGLKSADTIDKEGFAKRKYLKARVGNNLVLFEHRRLGHYIPVQRLGIFEDGVIRFKEYDAYPGSVVLKSQADQSINPSYEDKTYPTPKFLETNYKEKFGEDAKPKC